MASVGDFTGLSTPVQGPDHGRTTARTSGVQGQRSRKMGDPETIGDDYIGPGGGRESKKTALTVQGPGESYTLIHVAG